MKLIEAGTMGRNLGKKDMVFCLIYCEDATPYESYDNFKTIEEKQMNIPLVLSQFRWDGKLGFPGGNVEKHHNNLMEAILDELEEELGFKPNEENLELHATFADDKKHITSFRYKVDYDTIKEIQLNAPKRAKHFYAENCGVILLQMHDKSIQNIMEQKFSGTGKDELSLLIENVHLRETQKVRKALNLAKSYFINKTRDNGNNYYDDHILKVYNEVVKLDGREQARIDAILHDMYEDTDISKKAIKIQFGDITNKHIEILTIDKTNEFEEVKKAMTNKDTELVRFADRYSNLKCTSVKNNSEEFVNKMIRKTREYYIPNFEGRFKALLEEEVVRLENEVYATKIISE